MVSSFQDSDQIIANEHMHGYPTGIDNPGMINISPPSYDQVQQSKAMEEKPPSYEQVVGNSQSYPADFSTTTYPPV